MQTAQRRGRYGHRDATMILLAYRHGFRVAELCALRWDQVDLKQGLLHVQRLKQGLPSVHPLRGPELRALRRVQRDMPSASYVFTTERGSPMTSAGFRKLLARTGDASTLAFPIHPHMLRHACGYKLANDGHDTRGSCTLILRIIRRLENRVKWPHFTISVRGQHHDCRATFLQAAVG